MQAMQAFNLACKRFICVLVQRYRSAEAIRHLAALHTSSLASLKP